MMKKVNFKLFGNLFVALLLSVTPVITAHAFTISGNKVGIGTNTPSQSLDVVGNINASGSITANVFNGSGAGLTGINGANITTDSVGPSALVNGAVTAGKVSANAISRTNLDFLGKVVIVATSGGDYNNPATAMSEFNSWCGTPSATNPCLLKIMPGVYDVGTTSVQMQPYVDIEGSGENTTVIQGNFNEYTAGTVSGASNAEIRFLTVKNIAVDPGATAVAINNSFSSCPKITNVTATCMGGYDCIGIRNVDNSSPVITNVTTSASGGTSTNFGVYNIGSSPTMSNVTTISSGGFINSGVYNYYSSSIMINVTAAASGGIYSYGVKNEYSSPIMTNVKASASTGTYNYGVYNILSPSPIMMNVTANALGGTGNFGVDNYESSPAITNLIATASGGTENIGVRNNTYGTVKINHSVIKGDVSIKNFNSALTFIGNSQLDGGVIIGVGTLTCVGVYNGTYVALNTSCQ